MWVVPEKAKNKDLAYKCLLDITMRPENQALLGKIAAACRSRRRLPTSQTPTASCWIDNFNVLTQRDGTLYLDWPTPTFYDRLS